MSQMMSGIKVGKKTSVLHSSQFESKLSDHLSMYFLSAIIIMRVRMQEVSLGTMYGEYILLYFRAANRDKNNSDQQREIRTAILKKSVIKSVSLSN